MAILLYCVAKRDAPGTELLTGVAGDPVVRVELADLAIFTSSNPDKSNWLSPQLQASALEFHGVLSEIFESTAIIPFRFPTVFDDEKQLSERMRERAPEYAVLLDKFRELAQMEIRITNPDLTKPIGSGAQYLKLRQISASVIDNFAAGLRATLSELSHDWRRRPSKDGTRAFVLIQRNHVADFRNILRDTRVPRELNVRVSGPWPVSEFIEAS